MGNTLTTAIYNAFAAAGPYANLRAEHAMPASSANVSIALGGWKLGDSNYPINPVLTVTNKSAATIPGGTVVEFDYAVSAPADMSDQPGYGLKTTIGGFKATFNHAQFTIPSWQSLAPGASMAITLNYRLPISGPSAYVITIGGMPYALADEYPALPVGLK